MLGLRFDRYLDPPDEPDVYECDLCGCEISDEDDGIEIPWTSGNLTKAYVCLDCARHNRAYQIEMDGESKIPYV